MEIWKITWLACYISTPCMSPHFEQATLLASVKTSLAKYLLFFRVRLAVWIETQERRSWNTYLPAFSKCSQDSWINVLIGLREISLNLNLIPSVNFLGNLHFWMDHDD